MALDSDIFLCIFNTFQAKEHSVKEHSGLVLNSSIWQFAAAQLIRLHLFKVCLFFIVSCSFAFSFHYAGTFGSSPHMLINLLVHLSHFPPGRLAVSVTSIIPVFQISFLMFLPPRSPTWTSKTGKVFFQNCHHYTDLYWCLPASVWDWLPVCLFHLTDCFTKDKALVLYKTCTWCSCCTTCWVCSVTQNQWWFL